MPSFYQFEQSYWDGNLKSWLISHLGDGHPRANNGLERCNRNMKDGLTFNQLVHVNGFLHNIITWLSRESKCHCNLCDDSLMEHVSNKISQLAIARIRHLWCEGQNHNYSFVKKTNFAYAFKSGHSRRCLEQANVFKLCQDYSRVINTLTFDE